MIIKTGTELSMPLGLRGRTGTQSLGTVSRWAGVQGLFPWGLVLKIHPLGKFSETIASYDRHV